MLAAKVHGQFLPEADNVIQLEHVPNAGIRLLNVSTRNSGSYYVKVVFNVHGSVVTHTQAAHVQVAANKDVVKGGHLTASIQPGATFDNQTKEYHLVLACAKINSPWRDNAHITWTVLNVILVTLSQAQVCQDLLLHD
ncbi:hypothetical protein ACOMHN_043091 [Nucella lapillus]